MTQHRKEVARESVGTTTVSGTEWHVEHIVTRVNTTESRVWWELTVGLCNGVPRTTEQYPTKRAAMERFANLTRRSA